MRPNERSVLKVAVRVEGLLAFGVHNEFGGSGIAVRRLEGAGRMGDHRSTDRRGGVAGRVTTWSSRPLGVGVWVVEGAEQLGRKRSSRAAEAAASVGSVGTSPAASVRVLAFGEGARGLDVRGSGRGNPLGHGDRARH